MSAETILADLVAIPSVCGTPNADIVGYVRSYLARHGVDCAIVPGPEGDRANLFASIGPRDKPGYILSGHLDVVPASTTGWSGAPFTLRQNGERLLGRGAVDMKGFVACVLSNVPDLLSAPLAIPIHIALSYDEEIGCIGVRHLLARLPELCAKPMGCIVGEPTGMRPVLRHKGKIAQRITVTGRPGHSSRPELADNAIHYVAELMLSLRDEADRLAREGPFDARFTPPYSTLQVGTIRGGSNVNIVPEQCVFEIEARAIPATDPSDLTAPLAARIGAMLAKAHARNRVLAAETLTLSIYPSLSLSDDDPLVGLTEKLAQQPRQAAVSFGTEAGLYHAAGISSIVCGPGDVSRAHKTDEFITRDELAQGCAMIARLTAHARAI